MKPEIAFNLIDIEGTMAVALDAKRDEFNFALFGASDGQLKRLTDDLVLSLQKMVDKLSKISGKLHLTGNTVELRKKLSGQNFIFAEDVHSHPYGINVARLGEVKIKAGQTVDPQKFVPQYSHMPNIRLFKK